MEFRQVAHSIARGARPSLFFSATKPARSAFSLQQQQRHQSSEASAPAPPRTTTTTSPPSPRPRADNILQPRAPPAPVSRPSVLSSPRGAGLSSLYPPRPPRFSDPSQNGPASKAGATPPPPSSSNPWSIPTTIENDFLSAADVSGVARHTAMTPWNEDDFKERYGLDKVENIRLSPSLGRMVHVNGHVDPVKAILLCNKGTFSNRLTAMVNEQRFHERPALKRKRKLRQAWKRRFQKGFGAIVMRAMELRRQGW